jgi:hypothetical protein
MEINMIDRKGPEDFYKYYRLQSGKPVTWAMFRAIFNGFVKFIVVKLFQGFDVQLSNGHSLGTLTIRGKVKRGRIEDDKIKGLGPDWGNTRKLWKEEADKIGVTLKEYIATVENKPMLYHTNDHTNNVSYRFKWFQNGMNSSNKRFYILAMARKNRRTLPQYIRQGQEYVVLQPKIFNREQ